MCPLHTVFISKLISTANKFSSLYQPANFYTSILLMYIIQTIYILMYFFSSKGKFSADASEVFIPDNAMLLPRKCNETMMDFNVHFPRFYAVFATISPFINKRLFPLKLMILPVPKIPVCFSLYVAPKDSAASSIRSAPCF